MGFRPCVGLRANALPLSVVESTAVRAGRRTSCGALRFECRVPFVPYVLRAE